MAEIVALVVFIGVLMRAKKYLVPDLDQYVTQASLQSLDDQHQALKTRAKSLEVECAKKDQWIAAHDAKINQLWKQQDHTNETVNKDIRQLFERTRHHE